MSNILVTKPNTLSLSDRAILREQGVVVVEADNPADVKILGVASAEISGCGLLFAAMRALNSRTGMAGDEQRSEFSKAVLDELIAERKRRESLPRDDKGRFKARGEPTERAAVGGRASD